MICSQCGDPLERKPLVKPTQIFALIAVFAFIAPLIMMMTTFFRDQNKPSSQQFIHLIVVISTKP
ncbi:hypothetical protein EV06_0880 [Prochlorococcus sp. MIT 0602]|nr:hypothetical protein EV06_0880 [Prochlorococcus sp. MIT 0602]KGG17290.1 hypothetical protein EV07_0728 [Prochlorococcus sp. MIT 0603]